MYRFDHCYFFIIIISTYSEITLGTDYTNIRRTIAITKCFTFEFHFEWLFVVGKIFFSIYDNSFTYFIVCAHLCASAMTIKRLWCFTRATKIYGGANKKIQFLYTATAHTHKHQTTAKLPKYTEWFIKLSYYQWVFHRFPKCYIDI